MIDQLTDWPMNYRITDQLTDWLTNLLLTKSLIDDASDEYRLVCREKFYADDNAVHLSTASGNLPEGDQSYSRRTQRATQ